MSDLTKRGRGRPAQYDRTEALEAAMLLFWRHGYEGVSVADLGDALGLAPASLYAGFGSKEQLFKDALDHYSATRLNYVRQALSEEPTAQGAVKRVLRECALRYADPHTPPGCLVGSASLAIGPDHRSIAKFLATRRKAARDLFVRRFRSAQEAGEIASSADPETLASYYSAVVRGMSAQAIDGATSRQLLAVAEAALASWALLTGKR